MLRHTSTAFLPAGLMQDVAPSCLLVVRRMRRDDQVRRRALCPARSIPCLALAGLLLLLASCRTFDANEEALATPLFDALFLEAQTHMQVDTNPPLLDVGMAVTNISDRALDLEFGACALRLRAYRSVERSGDPVWRSEEWEDAKTGATYVCADYLVERTLRSGHTLLAPEFTLQIPIRDILGANLPDDRYYLTLILDLNGQASTEIDAGDVLLRRGT